MKTLSRFIPLLLLLFFFVPVTRAEWHYLEGPAGGHAELFFKAGDGTLFMSSANAGLFKSMDGGTTWQITAVDQIWAMSMGQNPEGRIYAILYPFGLAYSDDLFETYTLIGNTHDELRFGYDVLVTPTGAILRTGSYQLGSGKAIWRSTDDGETWTRVVGADISGSGIRGIYETSDGSILVPIANWGLFRSTDDGQTFANVTGDVEIGNEIGGIASAPNGQIIFASSQHYWFSSDDGLSWEIGAAYPTAIRTFCSPGDGFLYTYYLNKELYRSDNNGLSWTLIHQDLPLLDAIIASGDDLLMSIGSKAVVRSMDHAETWEPSNDGLHGLDTRWVSANESGTVFALAGAGTLYRFRDTEGWEEIRPESEDEAFVVFSASLLPEGRLIILTESPHTLFTSDDEGETWIDLQSDIDIDEHERFLQAPDGSLYSIANNLYHSTDGGHHFEQITDFMGDSFDMVAFDNGDLVLSDRGIIWFYTAETMEWGSFEGDDVAFSEMPLHHDPANQRVIVGGRDRLLVSQDHGATWSTLGNPILEDSSGVILDTFGRDADGVFHAAVRRARDGRQVRTVCTSVDDGETWVVNDDLANYRIHEFINGQDDMFYMSSYAGALRYGRAVNSVGEETQQPIPSQFELTSVYPNPFNPETMISFSVLQRTSLTLQVFDVLGRQVVQLAEGSYTPGMYRMTFDGSELASGTYFIRLASNSQSRTVRTVLMK